MTPTNPSCLTCQHSEPTETENSDLTLECRRYPPTLLNINNTPIMAFPQTFEGDYCGEHTPTEQEEP